LGAGARRIRRGRALALLETEKTRVLALGNAEDALVRVGLAVTAADRRIDLRAHQVITTVRIRRGCCRWGRRHLGGTSIAVTVNSIVVISIVVTSIVVTSNIQSRRRIRVQDIRHSSGTIRVLGAGARRIRRGRALALLETEKTRVLALGNAEDALVRVGLAVTAADRRVDLRAHRIVTVVTTVGGSRGRIRRVTCHRGGIRAKLRRRIRAREINTANIQSRRRIRVQDIRSGDIRVTGAGARRIRLDIPHRGGLREKLRWRIRGRDSHSGGIRVNFFSWGDARVAVGCAVFFIKLIVLPHVFRIKL